MQVQLLKKISVLQFVGRCVFSNAILRFEAGAPFPFVTGAVMLVTDCVFSNTIKIVKCRISTPTGDGDTQAPPHSAPALKRQRLELASA